MDTLQISYILNTHPTTKSHFKGVFAAEELPTVMETGKHCYVVNTDPSTKDGMHLLAFFLNSGKGEIFDSFGNSPSFYSKDFESFMNEYSLSWCYNDKRVQCSFSTIYGQYCISYLLKRCEGKQMKHIVNVLERTITGMTKE